jgi:hypothetical protein
MRNVVLTLARIWSTVATGEIRSKDAAAEWALPRLPEEHRAVLSRARTIYLGGQEEQWHDLAGRVRAHADHVAAEIRRLCRASPGSWRFGVRDVLQVCHTRPAAGCGPAVAVS